ncbi:MAG: hypothetical protein WAW36_16470 [Methylovulum miyakonense]|uniref:hypothetical protein n=1 Tax=Methylovulum miyakonense TaxID=645578 RepID=UPI003BB4DE3D
MTMWLSISRIAIGILTANPALAGIFFTLALMPSVRMNTGVSGYAIGYAGFAACHKAPVSTGGINNSNKPVIGGQNKAIMTVIANAAVLLRIKVLRIAIFLRSIACTRQQKANPIAISRLPKANLTQGRAGLFFGRLLLRVSIYDCLVRFFWDKRHTRYEFNFFHTH